MERLRVSCFSISVDGFGAGTDQDLQNPLGLRGLELHEWLFATRTFRETVGEALREGTTGVDDQFVARGFQNIGACIMGRNMFGPIRGSWGNEEWKGWWGNNPPFHVPVYVLTHHPRASIEMDGGTIFHFVSDGIESALEKARKSAGDADIRLGGGVATIREYLKVGLVDEMHLAVIPVLLGAGEHLLGGIDLLRLGYRCVEHVTSTLSTHVIIRR